MKKSWYSKKTIKLMMITAIFSELLFLLCLLFSMFFSEVLDKFFFSSDEIFTNSSKSSTSFFLALVTWVVGGSSFGLRFNEQFVFVTLYSKRRHKNYQVALWLRFVLHSWTAALIILVTCDKHVGSSIISCSL